MYEGSRWEQPDNREDANLHWLSGIVDHALIERARQYPLCEGWSVEQNIYQILLGVLVESGPELSPATRKRLRNLIGVFRLVAFPNMTQSERDSIVEWSQATTFDAKSLEYEINKETIEDIHWLWNTFDLQVPRQPDALPNDLSRLYRALSSGADQN